MKHTITETFQIQASYKVPCIYPKLHGGQVHTTCIPPTADRPLTVTVPGSKSITNRALLLATLADGFSTLRGVLFSDDSRHFLKCIQALGIATEVDEQTRTVSVTGTNGKPPVSEASLYVGSAGTAARFLTAFLGITEGTWHMDASAQMRKRPMAPLLSSLSELGCDIEYAEGTEGFFPFILKGHGFGTDEITINIDHSSQFLSALLIAACLCKEDFSIRVEGSHGMAYIDMTCKMMTQFGITVERPTPDCFVIKAGQHYKALTYQIEPDVSAACYFYAMVPLLGIPICVKHIHFDSLQGDVEFIRILEKMGCRARDTENGIVLLPPENGQYSGITTDMSACSDQAITLAAIAPFAQTPTTITGIGHIRFQESDRLKAIVTELTKMNIRCEQTEDSVTIYPGIPTPSLVETYDDHRMAMGFSLTGLRSEGIVINDPDCCRKTFENYFDVLTEVIRTITSVPD